MTRLLPRAGPGGGIANETPLLIAAGSRAVATGRFDRRRCGAQSGRNIAGQRTPAREKPWPSKFLIKIRADLGHGYNAVAALGKIGPAAVPALTELLGEKVVRLVQAAAMALEGIGSDAKSASPRGRGRQKRQPLAPEAAGWP